MDKGFNTEFYLLFEIWECFKLFWPLFLLAGLIALLIYLWARAENKAEKPSFLLLTSFSVLGITIGILTGWSRSPVVGTTISAIMGLLGGLSIYLVGKKESPRTVVSSCMIILSIFLLIGTYLGCKLRVIEIEYDRKYEAWLLDYKRSLQDKNAQYAAQLEVWKKEGLEGIEKRNKTKGDRKLR